MTHSEQEESAKEHYSKNKWERGGIQKFTSNFILETKFPDEESAINQLKAEGIWRVDPGSVNGGRKVHYRCNRANINGSPCSILKCLYFPKHSEEVWMYKTNIRHDHDKMTPVIPKRMYHPLEISLKTRISKLLKLLKTPIDIFLQLEYEGFDVKHRRYQIRNYCSAEKRKINPGEWRLEKKFNTIDEAELYLKRQKIWNYKFQNDFKYYYRCKLVPREGPQCAARKYFRFNKCTNKVTLYRMSCPHTHKGIIRLGHLGVVEKRGWLLKQLSNYYKNLLKHKSFRILKTVSLEDCLVSTVAKKDWLLKQLRECDRSVLKDTRFKVLKAVSLKNCLVDRDNYNKEQPSHTNHQTKDLLLCFQESELFPDSSYPNSNIIEKNELIIADEITQPASNANNDAEQKKVPKIWHFQNKFANISEASNFLIASNGQWQLTSGTQQRPFFRCTYPCEPECPARLSFLIKKGYDEVFYFSGESHSHPVEIRTEPSLTATEEFVISNRHTHPKNVSEIPFLNGFTFKEKFPNELEARYKMGKGWISTSTSRQNNEKRQYFLCNTEPGKCTCRAVLLRVNGSNEILYYTSHLQLHTHTVNLSEKETTEIENSAKITKSTDGIISRKPDDSDKDSFNCEGFGDTQEKWTFETKFDDYETAKLYMTNLNLLSPSTEDILCKSNLTNHGGKEYYNCNLVGSDVGHCPASKYLFYEDIYSDTLVYTRNIRHAEKCTNLRRVGDDANSDSRATKKLY